MAKNIVVGQVGTPDWLKKYSNINTDILNQLINGDITLEQYQMFNEHKNPFIPGVTKTSSWLDVILEQEKKAHLAFFGREFGLTQFAETLQKYGKKKILYWKKMMLEPHFIPKALFMPTDDYLGWKKKPENWFYENVEKGKILQNINGELVKLQTVETDGITLLIDTRCKPQYTSGSQMYENDNFLGPLILKLRKEEKIQDYSNGPRDSRFNVSTNEFETQLRTEIAELLKLNNVSQIRLEKTIEANLIPQLYQHMPRKDDGNTNTWCWYDEYFGGRALRLSGGDSDCGGLSNVGYRASDIRWNSRSVRPVAVL